MRHITNRAGGGLVELHSADNAPCLPSLAPFGTTAAGMVLASMGAKGVRFRQRFGQRPICQSAVIIEYICKDHAGMWYNWSPDVPHVKIRKRIMWVIYTKAALASECAHLPTPTFLFVFVSWLIGTIICSFNTCKYTCYRASAGQHGRQETYVPLIWVDSA